MFMFAVFSLFFRYFLSYFFVCFINEGGGVMFVFFCEVFSSVSSCWILIVL